MPKQSSYKRAESEYNAIQPVTEGQRQFCKAIQNNQITLCQGYPGTGKTLLALNSAIMGLRYRAFDRIVYARSFCEVDGQKDKGALPGDNHEKFVSLIAPAKEAVHKICSEGKANYILNNTLQGVFLEDLRGCTFDNSFVLVDEAQNITPKAMFTVLTRLGDNSKLVIVGDANQKDTSTRHTDGLTDAMQRYKDIPDIGMVRLGLEDIVRNSLLQSIVRRYVT